MLVFTADRWLIFSAYSNYLKILSSSTADDGCVACDTGCPHLNSGVDSLLLFSTMFYCLPCNSNLEGFGTSPLFFSEETGWVFYSSISKILLSLLFEIDMRGSASYWLLVLSKKLVDFGVATVILLLLKGFPYAIISSLGWGLGIWLPSKFSLKINQDIDLTSSELLLRRDV